MDDPPPTKRSFSAWIRWGYRFDLVVRTLLVVAVLVMLNYLGGRWYQRYYLNAAARQPLSPRTLGLLAGITNDVRVTLYFDPREEVYEPARALLDEYHDRNSRVAIHTVNYVDDAGAALKFKEAFKDQGFYNLGTNRDLVIFECAGRIKTVSAGDLAQYATDKDTAGDPSDGPMQFRKRMLFSGEKFFDLALLSVLNPKPLKACYITGHGEPSLRDAGTFGYLKFLSLLGQNNIATEGLTLLGTNAIPDDCNLLIEAGPTQKLEATELEKIDNYLRHGGRMLCLYTRESLNHPTGMERLLDNWGVKTGSATVIDNRNALGDLNSGEFKAVDFSDHPLVKPLKDGNSALHLVLPRPVGRQETPALADAPKAEPIVWSSAAATLEGGGFRAPGRYPLAVAVEKGNVRGVITERGTTRLVVVGDSHLFGNYHIESAGNRDFAHYAINWLLERSELMLGMGPRSPTEYRLSLGAAQRHTVQGLLLGALPGTVLFVGGLVWFRRRK